MDNLYEYREMIEILNIIILTSIIILSTSLYLLYRNSSFIILTILYICEICVSFYTKYYISDEIIEKNILYLISLVYLIKILGLTIFYKKINFKLYLNFLIIIGYIVGILSLSSSYEISLIISLLINILIVILGLIDKINNVKRNLSKNKHKLILNKKYISKSIKEIHSESNLKYDLKEKIKTLNYKIENTMEVLDVPIFILDEEYKYIYGNKVFQLFLERDGVDLNKIGIKEYLKNKVINYKEMIENIKSKKEELGKIINIYTYSNKVFKFSCNSDIINGKKIKICILEDVTDDMNMSAELKESEERYRNLMNILHDGVVIHNLDIISYINDKALEIFNINKNVNKVLVIDDIKSNITRNFKKRFMKNIELVKSGKEERVITNLETEDGKIIEFITTSINLNNTPMLLSMVIDITDLENAKLELEESEKTYKLLLQALPEGIVIIDKKTKVHTYRNKSMIKILKHIGYDRFNEIVKEYVKSESYGKFKKFSNKDDRNTTLSIAITDLKEDNNLVCVVSVLDNEYRSVQMVEKLTDMENKYKFKTEFLYTIAENLKKPINTIFEVNKILQNSEDRADFKYIDNYAKVVRQNSYRLKRLLNNIEEISKIENGILDMNYSRCDVVKFTENIVMLAREYANDKNLEILFIKNINKKIILIDKDKIEKMLLNLLSNAIKFNSNNGKILVSINSNKDEVIISVEDTGVGIPEDKIESIFGNFEQVDTTLSRGAEGTGVGLALVKKLADAHNAKINVYSKVGYGSKFEIVLENNNILESKEDEQLEYKDTDIEKIDIEFSDIYFDIGS
ncbi:PAS domain-containing sensor histidine kinase [Romboutsia sp. CE17]|uniref:sensor histidine kinase n=1 Tax=Romboutsia sp. CE17 TaxID=2724150 RepID=UPI001442D2BC|nr:PAS domain-containing sensor histidine kinase [Romboutsia sp. CE17]QJA09159.1 PAS domain-containing sensor histidine kinase [Romboutsia sp. CE17]